MPGLLQLSLLPGMVAAQLPGAFSVTLGEASSQYPRNSEGDVVVLKDGRLLACWTRFYGGTGDESKAEIAARLSADDGRTWSEPFVLQPNVGQQNVMSASFLRERKSGDLLLFYLVKNSDTDLKVYCRRSSDEGAGWGEPVVVTDRDGYHCMNNGRVLQHSSGRILAPVSFCSRVGSPEEHFRNAIFYSDDGGHTWKRAPDLVDLPKRGAMEPGLIELRDHRVIQIIRTQLGEVYQACSCDDGLTWSKPEPLGVAAPEAPSTIARIPTTGDLVLFYNPTVDLNADHCGRRAPLSVAVSQNERLTWKRTVDLETNLTRTYAYLSCTFKGDRALLTYYASGCPLPGGLDGLSQRFLSVPITALYGSR